MKFLFLSSFLLLNTVLYAQLQNIPLLTTEGQSMIKVRPDYAVVCVKVSKPVKLNTGNVGFEIFRNEETKLKLFDFDEKNIAEGIIQVEDSVYTKEIYITIYDLSRLDKTLLELNKLGFIRFHYIDYRVKNMTELKYQAKMKAIGSAKYKAVLLAKEIGQLIGKAHTIEELGTTHTNWYNFKSDERRDQPSYSNTNDEYINEPGMIVITAKVRVSFDLIK